MTVRMSGPPCATCGRPATGMVSLNFGANWNQTNSPMEPRCNEHNPYMVKCRRGHWQWGGSYCGTCGAKL